MQAGLPPPNRQVMSELQQPLKQKSPAALTLAQVLEAGISLEENERMLLKSASPCSAAPQANLLWKMR